MTSVDPSAVRKSDPSAAIKPATLPSFENPRLGLLEAITGQLPAARVGPTPPPQQLIPEPQDPVTITIQDPLKEMLERERVASDRRMMMSFAQAVRSNPDLAGEAHELGIEFGLDPLMVERNIDKVRELVRQQNFMASRESMSATTRRQFENPEFARIAYDDVGALTFLEKVANTFSEIQTVSLAFTGFGPRILAESNIGKRRVARKLQTEMGLLGMKRVRFLMAPGPLHPDLTEAEEARIAEINARIEELPKGAEGFISGFAGFLGQQQAVADQVFAIAGIVAAGSASVGLLGGPAAPVTVTAGAIGGFATGMVIGIAATTHDIEGGAKFLELVDRGVDPMRAARIASGVAFFNAALEVTGAVLLAKPLIGAVRETLGREVTKRILQTTTPRAMGNFVRDWALSVGGEATTEGLQEVVSFRADIAAGVDPGDLRDRVLDAFAESVLEVGLIGGFGATIALASDLKQVSAVEQTQAVFTELTGAARATKTLGRSADTLRGFAQAATGGNEVSDLYIDPVRFVEAMEETGFTREQLAEIMPDLAQNLDDLVASKTDVVIPVADYAAKVSPFQAFDAALQQDIRFIADANAKTIRMAVEVQTQRAEMIEETAKEVEELVKKDQAFAKSLRKVNDRLLAEIKATGALKSNRQQRDAATLRANMIGTVTVQMNKVQEATGEAPLTPEDVDTLFRGRVVSAAEAPGGVQLSQELTPEQRAALQQVSEAGPVAPEARAELQALGLVQPTPAPVALPAPVEPQATPAELTESGQRALETGQAAVALPTPELHQSAPATFFSALAREIEGLPTKATTVSGWKQAITGLLRKGKIKKDEVEWTGLLDWLDLQDSRVGEVDQEALNRREMTTLEILQLKEEDFPRVPPAKVSKEEVLEFLRNNGVRVERVELGEGVDPEQRAQMQARLDGLREELEGIAAEDRGTAEEKAEIADIETRMLDIDDELRRLDESSPAAARFAEHVVKPRGENYREVLMVLPVIPGESPSEDPQTRLQQIERSQFTGGHFDQPNVVAHIRIDDRTDAEGNRVLFVNEIQSDWAQKGRKEGFAGDDAATQARREEIEARLEEMSRTEGEVQRGTPERQQLLDELTALSDERKRLTGLPRAPFVETTKGWLNLALKQILLEAVNGGYDKVAFVNGEQAADLFDLSQSVESIGVDRNPDRLNGFTVRITAARDKVFDLDFDENSDTVTSDEAQFDGKLLSDIVGKEMADRIREMAGAEGFEGGVLEGEDLKVGGEGQKAFYDRMVPQAASKLSKKLGGGKVGEVEVQPTGLSPDWTVELEVRLPGKQEWVLINPQGREVARFDDEADANGALAEAVADQPAEAEVATQPALTITEPLRESVEQGLPLFQKGEEEGGPRGGFIPEKLLTILYKGADFSTWAHETAHFYIEVMSRIVASPNAPAQMVADMKTFLDWAGIKDLEAWNAMTVDQQRKAQESFAYSYEIFIFEGKSATLALESFFERMRAWMMRLYGNIRRELNATYREEFGEDLPILTGEVREVMDRMLATEEAIESTDAARNMAPLFENRGAFPGTDEEWVAYQQDEEKRLQEALNELSARSMGDMQWLSKAEGRRLRELQVKHRVVRERVRAEVAVEVAGEPVYRAMRLIRKGELEEPDGTVVKSKENTRLQTDAVRSIAPDADLVAKAVTSPKGIMPDVMANMVGFDTGEQLVNAILKARPIEDVISERTDVRMTAEHADLTDPQAVQEAVQESLHTEAHARFTATSLKALTKGRQPVRLMVQAARSVAQHILGAMPVSQIKAWRFHGAEARANKAARTALAKGDTREAIVQTRAELLQHELARAAAEIDKEATKAEARFKRFYRSDKKLGKNRDIDLIRSGRALLAAVQYAPRAEDQQATLTAESLKVLATDFPAMAERVSSLTDEFGGKSHRDMPLSAFQELDQTLKALWDLSKESQLMETEDGKLEVKQVSGDLQVQVRSLPARTAPNRAGAKASDKITPSGFARRVLRGWGSFASLKRFQHYAHFLDGGNPNGPFTRFILNPMIRLLDAYRARTAEILDRLHPQLMKIAKESGDAWDANIKSRDDELGGKVFRGKKELLGMMLHNGSYSNLEKFLVGGGFAPNPRDTDGILITAGWDRFMARMFEEGKITEADVRFVVSVWSEFKALLPEAQKTHRKIYGYEFEQIKLKEFRTPFGNFEGGYAPAHVDYDQADAPNIKSALDGLQSQEDAFQYSISTGRGFTITRNPNFHKPLQINVSRIMSHFDDELRFIFLQPHVRNVVKIVKDRAFEQVMNSYDREAINRIILPWLDNTARQKTFAPSDDPFTDALLRWSRNRGGLVALGLNYANAAIQLTGVFTGRTQIKAKHWRAGVFLVFRHPIDAWKVAREESIRMRERSDLHTQRQQEDIRRMFFGKTGRAVGKVADVGARFAFFPQRILQGLVDVSIWHAAKQQFEAESAGTVENMNDVHRDAVTFADNAVERSQGSGNPESLAAYESGSALSRLFLQFSSYSNGVLNQILGGQTTRERVNNALWTLAVVGAAEALLRMPFDGTPGDENDDGEYWDDWAKLFAERIGRNITGLVPLGGAFLSAGTGDSDRIASSPAAAALGATGRGLLAAAQGISPFGDEDSALTGRGAKDIAVMLTVITGLPLVPIGKSIGYAIDVESGRIEPRDDADRIRGILTGRAAGGTRR